jgi:hypothetical protein
MRKMEPEIKQGLKMVSIGKVMQFWKSRDPKRYFDQIN